MHKLKALLHPTFALVCGLLASACVDEFKGANIQVDFGAAVPAQVRGGVAPIPGFQQASNTHYRLYGIREVRDNSGAVLSSTFTELQRFEIHRIVEKDSPCFIEPDEARYPGLQALRYESRIKADTGIIDVKAPPTGATEEQLIDVATAEQRTINVTKFSSQPTETPFSLQSPFFFWGGLKAVTSISPAQYPAVGTLCAENNPNIDRSLIPPATCTDDESNKIRFEVCSQFWEQNPDFYEGTDRVLTEPLSGTYFGIVTGQSPVNNAVLGGTQFFVEDPVLDYDAFAVHLLNDDPAMNVMETGTQLLIGRPNSVTRGVTRAVMINPNPPPGPLTMLAQFFNSPIAIFSDLGGDDVHF